MTNWNLHRGDCLEWLKTLPDNHADSVITDPPYLLGFMGKEWDSPDGIAGRPDVWKECLRVMKPGGHLLAFGGSRTYHRIATAIEDAGFDVRDQIMWLYGTGFPKSLDVSKAIDKAAGAEREVVGVHPHADKNRHRSMANTYGKPTQNTLVTAPATDDAKTWQGWGTALKPAHEPIVVARKPLAGTVAANVLTHGTGGLNIDGCRVPCEPDDKGDWPVTKRRHADVAYTLTPVPTENTKGRWPANVIHDGSDSGSAARFFYCAKASKRERGEGNNHPTVKPLALMRYLSRLVTPPGGLILDPFAGSGSGGVAAIEEGFRWSGCELSGDYADIIEGRLGNAVVAA